MSLSLPWLFWILWEQQVSLPPAGSRTNRPKRSLKQLRDQCVALRPCCKNSCGRNVPKIWMAIMIYSSGNICLSMEITRKIWKSLRIWGYLAFRMRIIHAFHLEGYLSYWYGIHYTLRKFTTNMGLGFLFQIWQKHLNFIYEWWVFEIVDTGTAQLFSDCRGYILIVCCTYF